jgi:MFS family permease
MGPAERELERHTLRRQTWAAPFDALLQTGMQFAATIAKKSLGASDLQITLLIMVAPLCFLLSVYWAELIRVARRWRRLFLLAAGFGVLPLALMAVWGSMPVLLALLLLYELGNSLTIPLRNRVMQANYPAARRSRHYSRLAAFTSAIILLASWPAGRFLDAAPLNWRWVFLAAAACGLAERLIWHRMPDNPAYAHTRPALTSPDWMGRLPAWHQWAQPIQRMRRVLDRNRDFARWEGQFMIYGLAFFIISTVQPGYLVEGLGLSYSQISVGQLALMRLGGAVALPLMGRIHDRLNPAAFCARVFFALAFFPLLLSLCLWLPASLRLVPCYLAFFLQGVAMSGVAVAWSMSSLVFAGDEDGALYQGIHVTLTGFRGLLGPLLGLLIMSTLGWTAAFWIAGGLLFLAAFLMQRQGAELDCRSTVEG